jgi:hypothetical protein
MLPPLSENNNNETHYVIALLRYSMSSAPYSLRARIHTKKKKK